jgi:hypothetical protein
MIQLGLRRYPHLYEANAVLFVKRLCRKYGKTLTLDTIPDEEWQSLRQLGFDIIWLMGVWQRSPGAREKALGHPDLRREYERVLPGFSDKDIAGSPYAVFSYELDPSLGKPDGLSRLKSKLNRLGLRLVLDFAANHLAFDHYWVSAYPKRFIHREAVEGQNPGWFTLPEENNPNIRRRFFAHGRDPNFPPWTDTAQADFFSPDMRQALIGELKKIAVVADGVRCDMAMLALNDVFQGVWGKASGYPRPENEFWSEAINRVKEERPDFLFIAEAYWDLERRLQQLGFDFTYDKTLFDRLKSSGDIKSYLAFDGDYQKHSVHFIENHDEQRAVTTFGRERSLAAAVIMTTVPGLRLIHDGQIEGARIHIPVQIVSPVEEPADPEIKVFYEHLLSVCSQSLFHEGDWRLLDFIRTGSDNKNVSGLLAWCWSNDTHMKAVVVNYSGNTASGRLILPGTQENDPEITFNDELTGASQNFSFRTVTRREVLIELKPWEAKILNIK